MADRKTELRLALQASDSSVQATRAVASEALHTLEAAINDCLHDLDRAQKGIVVRDREVITHIREEYDSVTRTLLPVHRRAREDLIALAARKSQLVLALFGRTKVGKSTLMEVITHGDGSSIGMGAQRTTRRLRTCDWNGLTVIDTPGIGAFDGQPDEDLALGAAKRADLVVFLLSDDAPQPVDAEWYVKVRRLDKPVLCVLNVKSDVRSETGQRRLRRDPEKILTTELAGFQDVFRDLVRRDLPNESPELLATHLDACFTAGRLQNQAISEKLYRFSRFEYIEQRLVSEIRSHGRLSRSRTITATVAIPLMKTGAELVDFSWKTTAVARKLTSESENGLARLERFRQRTDKRIAAGAADAFAPLSNALAEFSEEHVGKRDAREQWERLCKTHDPAPRVAQLAEHIKRDLETDLTEFTSELHYDLPFATRVALNVDMDTRRIRDHQRIARWSVTGLVSGLGVAALFTSAVAPFVLPAAIGGSLLVKALEPGENRRGRRRLELERALSDALDREKRSTQQALCTYRDGLVTQTRESMGRLADTGQVLERTAAAHEALARRIHGQLSEVNRRYLSLAARDSHAEDRSIRFVARVPGEAVLVVFDLSHPPAGPVAQRVPSIAGERVLAAVHSQSHRVLLQGALGVRVQVADGPRSLVLVSPEQTPRIPDYRVQLAQQVLSLKIVL